MIRDTITREQSGEVLGSFSLRNLNRLLRPFNIVVCVFVPDDDDGFMRIELVRGKYPLNPRRG